MNVSRVGDPGVCFTAVDIVSLCTSLMGKQLITWPVMLLAMNLGQLNL